MPLFRRLYDLSIARPPAACAVIAMLAFAIALAFILIVYPVAGGDLGAVLDPDDYGPLGFGIWKNGSLTYYPETAPSIFRGPLYPALMAASLAMTGGAWPLGIQIVQAFL